MRVGIVGYGQFGRFMATHVARAASVGAYDPQGGTGTLAEVGDSDLVIFAVPVQQLEAACEEIKPHLRPSARIADVTSVKVRPLDILQKHFPNHELLGTHPIFGPQSGKNGIEGLPIVLTNVSWTAAHYAEAKAYLESLKLKVIERTPELHDKEMAQVQGLAHFIGRALKTLNIVDYETGTKSYHHLVELRDLLKDDSWELFQTIQNENPHAAEVREAFLAALGELQDKLSDAALKRA